MNNKLFSNQLSEWLSSTRPKTFHSLNEIFLEKSFAVALMLLLLPSALPIPTGGLTNALEILAMIIAVQMLLGRKTLWIPARLESVKIGEFGKSKLLPFVNRIVSKFEKLSKLSTKRLTDKRYYSSLLGLLLFVFTLGAFISPPFSGLDTLPSMGVVFISLSIILDDLLPLVLGLILGFIGMVLLYYFWAFVL